MLDVELESVLELLLSVDQLLPVLISLLRDCGELDDLLLELREDVVFSRYVLELEVESELKLLTLLELLVDELFSR